MSDTPDLVTIVYLVHPGQGYQPINLPHQGITLQPGRPTQVAPLLANKLLAKFPGTVGVVSFELEPSAHAINLTDEQRAALPRLGAQDYLAESVLVEGIEEGQG